MRPTRCDINIRCTDEWCSCKFYSINSPLNYQLTSRTCIRKSLLSKKYPYNLDIFQVLNTLWKINQLEKANQLINHVNFEERFLWVKISYMIFLAISNLEIQCKHPPTCQWKIFETMGVLLPELSSSQPDERQNDLWHDK